MENANEILALALKKLLYRETEWKVVKRTTIARRGMEW